MEIDQMGQDRAAVKDSFAAFLKYLDKKWGAYIGARIKI